MHIGFIDLGSLGRAIAGRLLDCGHSLTVWNRPPGKESGMGAAWIWPTNNRIPLFMGAMAGEIFAMACAEGLVAEDFSAVYKLFQGRKGNGERE
jgi:3-hydroxyisobutyrate dehydrogenase-like beta-hydroxyacid dehydrogenase